MMQSPDRVHFSSDVKPDDDSLSMPKRQFILHQRSSSSTTMEESFSDHEEDDDDIRFVKYLSLGFSEEQARNMVEKNKPHTKVVKKTTSNMSQLTYGTELSDSESMDSDDDEEDQKEEFELKKYLNMGYTRNQAIQALRMDQVIQSKQRTEAARASNSQSTGDISRNHIVPPQNNINNMPVNNRRTSYEPVYRNSISQQLFPEPPPMPYYPHQMDRRYSMNSLPVSPAMQPMGPPYAMHTPPNMYYAPPPPPISMPLPSANHYVSPNKSPRIPSLPLSQPLPPQRSFSYYHHPSPQISPRYPNDTYEIESNHSGSFYQSSEQGSVIRPGSMHRSSSQTSFVEEAPSVASVAAPTTSVTSATQTQPTNLTEEKAKTKKIFRAMSLFRTKSGTNPSNKGILPNEDAFSRALRLSKVDNTPSIGTSPAPNNSNNVINTVKCNPHDVKRLVKMGFSEEQSVQALLDNNQKIDAAIDALLTH